MADWNKSSIILITCPPHIPPFLAKEIEGLGMPIIRELDLGVATEGSLTDCMRLCLGLRTGHRVLYELSRFRATDPEWLYRNTRKIAWDKYIPMDGYVSVSCSINTDAVDNSMFASLKVKDAIVDRMREIDGQRPDSGKEDKGAAVFMHWDHDWVTLYLDCSGQPLSKRGYRISPHTAPMQETLAATTLIAAGYENGTLVNPMCGSGTLAIEAALMALGHAPGATRKQFAFQHLVDYDPQVWKDLKEDAELDHVDEINGRIIASDNDPKAIEAAMRNAKLAGVDQHIEFEVCDFLEAEIPEHDEKNPGFVMLNPEYGVRLGQAEELAETYKAIGDFFKQHCGGYTGCIFTGNMDLAKKVGLRTKRRIPLLNARIDCRLLTYELYAGSRKVK